MYLALVIKNSGGRQSIATKKPQKGGENTRLMVSSEKMGWGLTWVASAPSRASKKFPIVQKNVVLAKK